MGEKDHTQKMLIGCRDVFAELINVLVYSGEKVVNEADLLAGPTESLYIEADKQTHQQLRDCSMYELHNGEIHALYNLENQSIIEMPTCHFAVQAMMVLLTDHSISTWSAVSIQLLHWF